MKKLTTFLITILIGATFTACEIEQSAQEKGERKQEQVIGKAMKDVKVPDINNFRAREAVAEQMRRLDDPSKNWYIYVLSDMGNPIGYYVAKTKPISVGTYLTPPKKAEWGGSSSVVLPSPSLDGTYYGSGGGAAQQYFFFTRESNTYIEIKGLNYFCTDQPITSIDAPQFKVKNKTEAKK